MKEEIWKDIVGYEGIYKVSNLGMVKSMPKRIGSGVGYLTKERVLKGYKGDRYHKLALLGKIKYVHRLVAQSFIINPENKKEVNHKDGNKLNNHLSNLEWVTRSENEIHAVSTGLKPVGESHFGSLKINQYSRDGGFIKKWINIREAEKGTGILHTAIGNCLKGRSKTSGKYIWKYA